MNTTADPLRPITPADHEAVLAWNQAHVELLAPMDEARLVQLLEWCEGGWVITDEGRDVGFVLTFASSSAYDSSNFRWFQEHYQDFVYLDRIVIDGSVRRTGIGSRVYDAIEARVAAPVLCLEVNLDPPNEPSLAFHRRRGYVEVGQIATTGPLVSLMEKRLTPTR